MRAKAHGTDPYCRRSLATRVPCGCGRQPPFVIVEILTFPLARHNCRANSCSRENRAHLFFGILYLYKFPDDGVSCRAAVAGKVGSASRKRLKRSRIVGEQSGLAVLGASKDAWRAVQQIAWAHYRHWRGPISDHTGWTDSQQSLKGSEDRFLFSSVFFVL